MPLLTGEIELGFNDARFTRIAYPALRRPVARSGFAAFSPRASSLQLARASLSALPYGAPLRESRCC
jgi:hypothetical protein